MNDEWTDVIEAGQVTDEVMNAARSIADGWYPEGSIDWEDVWDRVDGASLDDGSRVHLGDSTATPAFKLIKRTILRERRG